MSKFNTLLEQKLSRYRIINEEGDVSTSATPAGAVPDAPASAPVDNSPTPAQGATSTAPTYDKPYQDLARILYKALRLDFDDLGPTLQQKIMNLNPDNIESDQQGVSIFKEVEAILNEQQGSDPSPSGFGPGANKL